MSKISVPSTGKPSDQNSWEKTEAGLWPATGVNPRVQSKPSTIKWPRVRSRRKISSTGASTNSQKNRLRVTKRRSCEPVFILYSGSRCPQARSEEHTSELQSREHLVCRLLLEQKNR